MLRLNWDMEAMLEVSKLLLSIHGSTEEKAGGKDREKDNKKRDKDKEKGKSESKLAFPLLFFNSDLITTDMTRKHKNSC